MTNTEGSDMKPIAKVTGYDSNVFVTLGICNKVLKKNNLNEQAEEMRTRVFKSGSYEEAIQIMSEYCKLR
jgi:hypothetical protein